MTAQGFPYARFFETPAMLVAYVRQMAERQESVAFAIGPAHQPRYGVSYVKDSELLTYFGVGWCPGRFTDLPSSCWDGALIKELCDLESQSDISIFGRPIGGHGVPMSGEMHETQIFRTDVPGLRVQVINWALWDSMCGGASIGGVEYVWLLNHAPVKTGR
jgi:hypothetical protein